VSHEERQSYCTSFVVTVRWSRYNRVPRQEGVSDSDCKNQESNKMLVDSSCGFFCGRNLYLLVPEAPVAWRPASYFPRDTAVVALQPGPQAGPQAGVSDSDSCRVV
jgi:hypothetical protein